MREHGAAEGVGRAAWTRSSRSSRFAVVGLAALALGAAVGAGCDSGSGAPVTGAPDGGGTGDTAAGDTSATDAAGTPDTADSVGQDTAGPSPDGASDAAGDTDNHTVKDTTGDGTGDAPTPGTKQLGEACDADGECASGLCFRVAGFKGCTVPCTSNQQCQDLAGLLCVPVRPGVTGCVPQIDPPAETCASHDDCAFPFACRDDTHWCDLPQCTVDGDCQPGERCELASRRCEPTQCSDTVQCKNPGEFCVDGACGPPLCDSDADCDAGSFCHAVQRTCQPTKPCDDEGKCSYYNEACVDGACVPNLCWQPCAGAGDVCDPATGQCGSACGSTADCGVGQACLNGTACVDNEPPLAVATGPTGQLALDATVGQPVSLTGASSVDAQGGPLTFAWTVGVAPDGSAHTPGEALGSTAQISFAPDAPGLYWLRLRVHDASGAASMEAQVAVVASP